MQATVIKLALAVALVLLFAPKARASEATGAGDFPKYVRANGRGMVRIGEGKGQLVPYAGTADEFDWLYEHQFDDDFNPDANPMMEGPRR